ncbi:MAG: cytochrome c3 family protein [Candidatus Riflebacteria bacterium]|nr:cytochrome c3 family protein [Candidatus Riflebacteria bacterium]
MKKVTLFLLCSVLGILPVFAETLSASAGVPITASGTIQVITNAECQGCHADKTLKREAGPASGTLVHVPDDALKGTPHEGFNCVDCHTGIKEIPHAVRLSRPACASCHPAEEEDLKKSVHGLAAAKGNTDAPSCSDCHGNHQIKIKSDPESPTNPKNLPTTCAKCHANAETSKRNHFNILNPLSDYQQSVHYKRIQMGVKAATCSECHGSHLIRKSQDPESNTAKRNIPKTCGKCHTDIAKVYEKSIHGQALARGVSDSPVCTDCHGEHAAKDKRDPTSSIYPENISKTTCPRCHGNAKMMSRYGIDTARLSSYEDTYHGLALKGGLTVTANCASCHGIHDILPSSNPESSVNSNNLAKTCGKCHPKANASFANIPVHSHELVQGTYEWFAEMVRQIYIVLIVLTIGSMLLHNAIILFHYIRQKLQMRREGPLHVRFTSFEVFNHLILVLSFTTLVLTGFALKFPDAFWVKGLSFVGLHESIRGFIHRIAGVVLICQGIIQTIWTFGTVRGRTEVIALLPWFTDLRDVFLNMWYHLGFTEHHPHFGRYSYIEKSEYWAMAWGTVVMAITGLMLWFPAYVTWVLPSWLLKIAEIVHYYEAWLATLAIIVWHMFFTFLHPKEYPFSITWLDGKISDEEFRSHHPQEYAALKSSKEAQAPEDKK